MSNRLITVASSLVIVGVLAYFATTTFSQSGRNRDAARREEPAPTLSNDDIPTAAAPAPTSVAPRPSTAVRAAGPIDWKTDFAEARHLAKPGQVIFVDVYTDWCGWCKYMDSRVYTDSAVQAFAADNVFVKVDAEDGGAGQAFARKVGVRGYPMLLVYSSDGKLIDQRPGAFRQAGDFVNWLQATSTRR